MKRIHPGALGGYTIEGPYFRNARRERLVRIADRLLRLLGA